MTFVTAFSLSGNFYPKQFFKLIFKMEILSYFLRTKWIRKRSIRWLRVRMVSWHDSWAGMISDMLFEALNMANCKTLTVPASSFPSPSPRAFALAFICPECFPLCLMSVFKTSGMLVPELSSLSVPKRCLIPHPWSLLVPFSSLHSHLSLTLSNASSLNYSREAAVLWYSWTRSLYPKIQNSA